MLEPVPGGADGWCAELALGRFEALADVLERGVADAVEAGLEPGAGAHDDVVADLLRGDVGVAAGVGASAYGSASAAVREPKAPSAIRSPASPAAPSRWAVSTAISSPQ